MDTGLAAENNFSGMARMDNSEEQTFTTPLVLFSVGFTGHLGLVSPRWSNLKGAIMDQLSPRWLARRSPSIKRHVLRSAETLPYIPVRDDTDPHMRHSVHI